MLSCHLMFNLTINEFLTILFVIKIASGRLDYKAVFRLEVKVFVEMTTLLSK
jgi:hypothetical protein